ncbi:MAG TPA: WD40 repeat domain-containing protein, partial [Ktedonobacterales bacterium]|nr:WD40 repeat domain-containing protein [Ktedonobacterales bacterium]
VHVLDGHYTNMNISNGVTGPVAPTGVFFSASPVLWSPDGRYVVSGVSMGGPVIFSKPPTATLTCPSPDQYQSEIIPCPPNALPQPDPAFAAVASATLKGESFTFTGQNGSPVTTSDWPEVPVAWSPNGKYLLTILPGDEEHDKVDQTTVSVFDTASGKAIKQYQQKIPASGASCSSVYPAWSPNGARIALAHCSTDSIILWNSGDLPT